MPAGMTAEGVGVVGRSRLSTIDIAHYIRCHEPGGLRKRCIERKRCPVKVVKASSVRIMGGGIVSGEFRVCAATENQKALTLRKKCESLVLEPSVT